MILQLLKLSWLFAKISFFTFGGGYAMIPLFQVELVENGQYLTATEFANLTAMAQITPGPIGMNSATYIGYQQGFQSGGLTWGILFATCTTIAVLLPSILLMTTAVIFLHTFRENRYMKGFLSGVRPAVAGLIAAAVLFFADTSVFTVPFRKFLFSLFDRTSSGAQFGISTPCLIVFLVALFLQLKMKWNIFLILCISAALGVCLAHF